MTVQKKPSASSPQDNDGIKKVQTDAGDNTGLQQNPNNPPGDIGGKKDSFSTREWWMLIALIIVIQWLVHFWSTEAMSSDKMVNYLSFAGTLVSTILAVIAIIYSFIQSISQQASSEIISREVYRLQSIVNVVNSSAAKANASLEKLPNVIEQLERIPHTVSETIAQGVTPLKEQNDGMQTKLEEFISYLNMTQPQTLQENTGNKSLDKDHDRYIKAIQFAGVVLSAQIVVRKGSYKGMYEDFRASVPEDDKSIVDDLFISLGSVLGSHFLNKVLSVDYNTTIEKSERCNDDEWRNFNFKQGEILNSFVRLNTRDTLSKHISESVIKKLFEILPSQVGTQVSL